MDFTIHHYAGSVQVRPSDILWVLGSLSCATDTSGRAEVDMASAGCVPGACCMIVLYLFDAQYTSTGFVARNRDTLQEDLQQALACSDSDGDKDDGRRNNLIRKVCFEACLIICFHFWARCLSQREDTRQVNRRASPKPLINDRH